MLIMKTKLFLALVFFSYFFVHGQTTQMLVETNKLLSNLVHSTTGGTSVYHPFPESNATWNFSIDCMMPNFGGENFSITIADDTVINSQYYHKLMTPFVQVNPGGGPCGTQTGYKGAFRQDLLNKKVYCITPYTSTEKLLYDFNWQVGDTILGCLQAFVGNQVIHAIDSVLVGGEYRKRWILDTCYDVNVVEGVGSTYGLVYPSPNCVWDQSMISMTCFKYAGMTLYPASATNCDLITKVPVNDRPSNPVIIYPNPSNGSFRVDIDPSIQVKEVLLTDLPGNIFLKKTSGVLSHFDINYLTAGTYFLRVIDSKNRLIHRKIISLLSGN
jgi:hypothetical protein